MSFSSWSSSGFNFFRGWRSMPGTIPATSQLDWLISITTMSVLSWFRAVKDRLRSFDCSMGRSKGLLDSAESAMPSPLAPYHLRVRTQDRDQHLEALRSARIGRQNRRRKADARLALADTVANPGRAHADRTD